MSGVRFVYAEAVALVLGTSWVCRAVGTCVSLGYLLGYWEGASEWACVTPGYLLPPEWRVWSALVFWCCEERLWQVLCDLAALALCQKLVEPLWGVKHSLLFFALVNLGVAFSAAACYLLLYAATHNTDYLFDTHLRGLAGYVAAQAVAVKQAMPDHLLLDTRLGRLTNTAVPLSVFLLSVCLCALGLLDATYPCMWACGTVVSWIYLRFWQRHNNGTRGDAAQHFAFHNFFPLILQPFLRPFEKCFAKLGICSPSRRRVHLALSPGGLTITLPGVEPQDMERRRQIALKALSERLSKTSEQAHRKSRTNKGSAQLPLLQGQSHGESTSSPVDFTQSQIRSSNAIQSTLINIDVPTTPALNQQNFTNS